MILSKRLGLNMVTAIIGFFFAILCVQEIESSPYVISDDRIRSLDITPVLGRGYSIATNSFQSTCLMVDETTVPSYNYDYYFTDFTKTTNSEAALQGKVSGSFGYFGIKGKFNAEYKQTKKFATKKHIVASTMRIERYYSSVREEESDLSRDAKQLLSNDDYVGFFKACGPNYVRSIRRAQEVTAIFEFESSSADLAQEFASSFSVSGWGSSASGSVSVDSKYKSMTESLRISIIGFGLGLNEDGSETLVATSMDQYNEVMDFAFKSMTQSENSAHIGMIYGIELVPWVDNTSFQVAAKIDDKQVRLPMPRSIIPRALPKRSIVGDDGTFPSFDNETNRKNHKCQDPTYKIDKFGYCCFPDQMISDGSEEDEPTTGDPTTGDPTTGDPTTGGPATGGPATGETPADPYMKMICAPLRSLDPSIKKNNMSNNGEFVALLDSIVRYRLNNIFSLEKCITAVNSIPSPRYDFYILKAQDTVKYDGLIEASYTVAELRMAIDPSGDYGLVKHMGRELDEFIEMYYEPCLSDLFGMNIGTNAGTDPMYFMAESWYNHESCSRLSCLADNMRWDRKTGEGCVPSLITGSESPAFAVKDGGNEQEDAFCKKRIDLQGKEKCETPSSDMQTFKDKADSCWKQTGARVPSPVYIMDHFCNPQVTDDRVTDEVEAQIKELIKCEGD